MKRIQILMLLLTFSPLFNAIGQQTGFNWVVTAGASLSDGGNDIVTGPDMSSYIGGFSNQDPWVLKISPTGSITWAKKFVVTVSSSARCYGVALDSSGNVYATGEFNGTMDANPGSSTANLVSAGSSDFYIIKLDNAGNYIWSKRVGGSNTEFCYAIEVDKAGDVIVTGRFAGTVDFNPGISTYNMTSIGTSDIFILKLNSSGNFVWAQHFGATSNNMGYGLDCDTAGNIYVTGSFNSSIDFDPGTGTDILTSSGASDIFVLKMDAAGNHLWAKRAGGTLGDTGESIHVDSTGNVYVSGEFTGTADFDPGAGTANFTSNGMLDMFVLKLDPAGTFTWVSTAGGTSNDYAFSLVSDKFGNVSATGFFNGTVDFDPGSGTHNITSSGSSDFFLWQLNSLGNLYTIKHFKGGTSGDVGNGITTDTAGSIYLTGYFQNSVDFDPGQGVRYRNSTGSHDLFVVKLGACDPTSDSVYLTACDSMMSPSGRYTWYSSGVYSDTLVNQSSCDSVITVFLTINFRTDTSLFASACDNYLFNGVLLTASGTYYDTLVNAASCDSVITLHLTIHHSSGPVLFVAVCDSFLFNGNLLTVSGIYYDTIPVMPGCDSIVVLDLTIKHSSTNLIMQNACGSFTLNGQTYNNSGIYTQILNNAQSCDSIITLNLTVNPLYSFTENHSICGGETYYWHGANYTTEGTYIANYSSIYGCDSAYTLILTVDTVDTGVTLSGITITADSIADNYQWIDCSTLLPVGGAINQSYAPLSNGSYAVIITQGQCSDTSVCINVTTVGIDPVKNTDISVYPNPATNTINIECPEGQNLNVTLLNLIGEKVMQSDITASKEAIDISALPTGMYFVSITMDKQMIVKKIIKQ